MSPVVGGDCCARPAADTNANDIAAKKEINRIDILLLKAAILPSLRHQTTGDHVADEALAALIDPVDRVPVCDVLWRQTGVELLPCLAKRSLGPAKIPLGTP